MINCSRDYILRLPNTYCHDPSHTTPLTRPLSHDPSHTTPLTDLSHRRRYAVASVTTLISTYEESRACGCQVSRMSGDMTCHSQQVATVTEGTLTVTCLTESPSVTANPSSRIGNSYENAWVLVCGKRELYPTVSLLTLLVCGNFKMYTDNTNNLKKCSCLYILTFPKTFCFMF